MFARAAPFALFIAFIALPHGMWATALRGVAVAALLALLWPRYTELRAAKPARASDWLLAIGVGLAVFFAWIHLDRGWMAIGRAPGFDPTRADGTLDWTLAGLRLFGLALVVPVMEELFWRSLVMRWIDARDFLALDPRRASWRAFVISSLVFASEHSLWLAGFAAGLGYGWVYLRTGNLWMSVFSHAITNGTLGLWILANGQWRFW